MPTDELLRVIITKSFSDKQIEVNVRVLEFILKNIDRSYEKINFGCVLSKEYFCSLSYFVLIGVVNINCSFYIPYVHDMADKAVGMC